MEALAQTWGVWSLQNLGTKGTKEENK